jgi:hypothetical protein
MSDTQTENLGKNVVRMPVPEADHEDDDTTGLDIFNELGQLSPTTLISEIGLGQLLGRKLRGIKRAIEAGELPRPINFRGQNLWTVGFLIKFFERELENQAKLFEKHRPK